MRPLDNKKVSPEITALTGITNEEAKSARDIWEVLPDFLSFAGDAVLMGYNCIAFDSKFMVRAGRYSHRVIENRYFDVMRYADKFKSKLGIDMTKISLSSLSSELGIENPRAHRALADAVTTARVFMKLREMDTEQETFSVSALLSDLDNW